MAYFVYYDEDYPYTGGTGFEELTSKKKAIKFIERRIGKNPMARSIGNYIVISGEVKEIKAVKSILHIKIA